MAEVNDNELTQLLEFGPAEGYRLSGIRETDSIFLGVIGLSKKDASFRCIDGFPFSSDLTATSRFIMRTVAYQEESVIFVIFRRFDSSDLCVGPDEIITGWVPALQEVQAGAWVAEMNELIRRSRAAQPIDPLRDGVDLTFEFRSEYSGSAENLVEIVNPRVGCIFEPAQTSPFGGRIAYQAVNDGQRVWLVECPAVAAYPRRFAFVSAGRAALLPSYMTAEELPAYTLKHLQHGWIIKGSGGLSWYEPTSQELSNDPLPNDVSATQE